MNTNSYEADFVVKHSFKKLANLIYDLDDNRWYFGQNNPEPKIVVENIPISVNDINIIGKNQDTVRFTYNNITYIKFRAKDLIEELKSKKGTITLTVIGKGNINEWNGKTSPQIIIDDIEIKSGSIYDF